MKRVAPPLVYGALDERVMSIYPDTLSPDLFTIKFETYGAGSKSPDTLLYLAKTIIEGVEVQEGEAITFADEERLRSRASPALLAGNLKWNLS